MLDKIIVHSNIASLRRSLGNCKSYRLDDSDPTLTWITPNWSDEEVPHILAADWVRSQIINGTSEKLSELEEKIKLLETPGGQSPVEPSEDGTISSTSGNNLVEDIDITGNVTLSGDSNELKNVRISADYVTVNIKSE